MMINTEAMKNDTTVAYASRKVSGPRYKKKFATGLHIKVMSTLKPRMAIAFHFFMDFNIAPGINDGIRTTYDGPLSLANDLMVWNVTKDNITVRNVAPIEEAWPARTPFPIPPMDPSIMKFESPEIAAGTFDVVKENQSIYDRINEKYGTNFELRIKK